MINWLLSLPLWLLIGAGIYIYINVGYRWATLSYHVANNFHETNWFLKFICLPGHTVFYLAGDKSIKMDVTIWELCWTKTNYFLGMIFIWPFKLAWCLLSFCLTTVFVVVYNIVNMFYLFFKYMVRGGIFQQILISVLFPFTAHTKDNPSWYQRWQDKRSEKRRAQEDGLKEEAEKRPLQEKRDRLSEVNKEIIRLQATAEELEAEIELSDTPFRGPDANVELSEEASPATAQVG